jgi:formylglycine-generating enzyme required for sulfatase activity
MTHECIGNDWNSGGSSLKRIIAGLVAVAALALAAVAHAAPEIVMVSIKGGCYQMGDSFYAGGPGERPVHQVCVDDFHIGKFLVSQAQWAAVMGNNPSAFDMFGGSWPVETVSWEDAQGFIQRLNDQTGKNYRLPYESEWEYAARSGGKQEQWAGTSDLHALGTYAWFGDNSSKMTHSVGTRWANGLGLYDMTGNVWQWCKDWYDADYYHKSPMKNPRGPLSGSERVLRGGSWYGSARDVRAAYRSGDPPSDRDFGIGFRLVLPAVR